MKKVMLFSLIILFLSCMSVYDDVYNDDLGSNSAAMPKAYAQPGQIAYFPFDGDLSDYSDSSRNYCIDHTGGVFVDGVMGQAKDFNGESDMLRIRNTLHSRNGLTFSFWIKSRGVLQDQQNGVVIGKYDDTVWGRCFMISTQASNTENDPSLRGNFYPDGTTSNYADGIYSNIYTLEDVPSGRDTADYTIHEPMPLPLNQWAHCVINVSDSTMEAWINGTLTVSIKRSYSSYNNISQYYGNDVPTFIGNLPHAGEGSNNHFNGSIDELRVYDRALSDNEIMDLLNYPDNLSLDIPSEGLVAYFPFDGDVTDYSDSSRNYCIDHTDGVYVNGISGQAKDFNGETDMLRIKNTLHVSNGLTFSFWLKSRGVLAGQENGVVIGKYDHTTWGRCFMINSQASWTQSNPSLRGNFYPYGYTSNYADGVYSDVVTFEDIPSGRDTANYTIHEPMKLPLNEWAHCVINVGDSTMEAWINGILTVSIKRSYNSYNDISRYFGNDVPTYIGNLPHAGEGSNNHYNGSIDELRIFNYKLSEQEILDLYQHPGGECLYPMRRAEIIK